MEAIEGGLDIQSHTKSHLSNVEIEGLSTAEVAWEYGQAIIDIEEALPVTVKTVAYSYGAAGDMDTHGVPHCARGTYACQTRVQP